MSEELIINKSLGKTQRYEELFPQIESLINGESDQVANLANIASALKYGMDFFWVGFYIVKGNELVLGPFQGPIACTRIQKGKGVCGKAWEELKTIIVPNVDEFPGHIACSADSKSEIVVPVLDEEGSARMVLDVDSDQLNDFDETDRIFLEKIVRLI